MNDLPKGSLILITGSRYPNEAMRQKARATVEKAHKLGHTIIVGDARGIDVAVINWCLKIGVPFRCCGKNTKPRYAFIPMENFEKRGNTFYERDEYMAEQCDYCIALWDGDSPGTHYTFTHAKKVGKRGIVHNFKLRG